RLRDRAGPNGTAELLVDTAMRAAAAEGSRYATMGLAPLSGPVHSWLAAARAWGASLYDFEGVRAFKAKFRPACWEPIYLAYPPGQSALLTLYDVLTAFARGRPPRFAVKSLLRAP